MRTGCIVGLVLLLAAGAAFGQVAVGRPASAEAAPDQEQKGSADDLQVESVLQQAHVLASQLAPTDRMEFLVRLAEAAGKKHPGKAEQWVMEALQLIREMSSSARRSQYQARAISELALLNSEEALDLLPGLEFSSSWKDCDARAGAPLFVFQAFLKQHPGGTEKLSAVAQRIGDTGNYPFRAVHILITRIGNKDPEAATALIEQAIQYYNLSAHDPCSNNQMATLLSDDTQFVPGSMLKAIVETMVSRLVNTDSVFSGSLTTTGTEGNEDPGLRVLNHASLAMLMRISSLDPDIKRKLQQALPSLDLATHVVAQLEGGQNIVELSDSPIEDHLSVVLSNASAQAPPANLSIAERPEGDDAEPTVQTPSSEDLASYLDDSEKALERDGDPEQRLQILLARGVSLVSAERPAELSNVLAEAFALGEKLFRKSVDDNPQASWKDRPGAGVLSALVELTAKKAPQVVLERLKSVQTTVLQAQLYVSFVEGVQSETDSPSIMVIAEN
jgi:hypothetical protein